LFVGLVLLTLSENPRIPFTSSTILQESSAHGWLWIVNAQLCLGVDPDWHFDRTPLIEAAINDHPRVAAILVSYGARLDKNYQHGVYDGPPVAWALRYGHPDVAEKVLQKSRWSTYIAHVGRYGLLHLAIESGDLDVVKRLAQTDEDPSVADDHGVTPLMLAVAYGRYDMADALIRGDEYNECYPWAKTLTGSRPRYCVFSGPHAPAPFIPADSTPISLAAARKDKPMLALLADRERALERAFSE
jgi:ankyrin repeat protein